jgi:hypothetical protein
MFERLVNVFPHSGHGWMDGAVRRGREAVTLVSAEARAKEAEAEVVTPR